MFEQYVGLNKVTSLRCYPIKFHRSKDTLTDGGGLELTAELQERGEAFLRLCTQENHHMMFDYDGELILPADFVKDAIEKYGESMASTVLQVGAAESRMSRRARDEAPSDDVSGGQTSSGLCLSTELKGITC